MMYENMGGRAEINIMGIKIDVRQLHLQGVEKGEVKAPSSETGNRKGPGLQCRYGRDAEVWRDYSSEVEAVDI